MLCFKEVRHDRHVSGTVIRRDDVRNVIYSLDVQVQLSVRSVSPDDVSIVICSFKVQVRL